MGQPRSVQAIPNTLPLKRNLGGGVSRLPWKGEDDRRLLGFLANSIVRVELHLVQSSASTAQIQAWDRA